MGYFRDLLAKLKPGESQFVETDSRNLWTAGRQHLGKGKFTVRAENGGARIWRIK